MKSVTILPIVREKPVAKTAIIMLKSAQSIAKAIAAKAHIRLNHIGLGGMIVMPVIRCIWRGCVSLFNKFTNFVHRFVSSKAVA